MPISISASVVRPMTAWCARALGAALLISAIASAAAAATPQIRSSARNMVPACVTPQRLMAFIKMRNRDLDPRFEGIAEWYRRHGEKWHVRWDYAFFQMAVETNFLTFRQGNGRWGDVKPRQNNFAGLGTTGGGVPGDSYPDVGTGVLAQIQHLVVYSGERIASPVGARTKLKQDDILESMASLKGRTTFSDLARRWAADRHYGASIEWVANSYRSKFCNKADEERQEAERRAAARRLREAKSAGELPPAAALGGPGLQHAVAPAPKPKPQRPVQFAQADASAPVRTIWSATQSGGKPARSSVAAPTPLQLPAAAAEPNTPAAAPAPHRPKAEARTPAASSAPVAKPVAAMVDVAVPSPAPVHRAEEASGVAAKHVVPVSVAAPAPALKPATELPAAQPQEAQAPTQTQAATPTKAGAFAFAAAMNYEELTASPEPEQAGGAQRCRVLSASYGGKKTLLVLTKSGGEARYTALTVLEGFERSMLANYLKAHAPGGASLGEFDSRDAALARARELCPGTASAPQLKAAAG